MTPLVHPAAVLCFHGPSCYHPQTGFPTAAFSRRRSAALLQMSEQIVKHFSCADLSPYVSLTFLPNVILALTENPSSKCVCQPPSLGVFVTLFPRFLSLFKAAGGRSQVGGVFVGQTYRRLNCCPRCSTLFFAFMVVFMIRPPNQGSMHGVNSFLLSIQ